MLINNYLSSYCSIKKILLLPQHTTEWKRESESGNEQDSDNSLSWLQLTGMQTECSECGHALG